MTIRAPGLSCSISAGGTWSGAAVTMSRQRALASGHRHSRRRFSFECCGSRAHRGPGAPDGASSGTISIEWTFATHSGEDGGLISRSGADLEDDVIGFWAHQFSHQRNDEGLRDRLAVSYFGNGRLSHAREAKLSSTKRSRATRWSARPHCCTRRRNAGTCCRRTKVAVDLLEHALDRLDTGE